MHGHLNVNLSRCTVTWTSIYHDAPSPERQFITMRRHMNVNLSRCTVTWTSIYHDAPSSERQFITMHRHLNVNISRCTVTWTPVYHDAPSPERQYITMHRHLHANISRCTVTWTYSTLSPYTSNNILLTNGITFSVLLAPRGRTKVLECPVVVWPVISKCKGCYALLTETKPPNWHQIQSGKMLEKVRNTSLPSVLQGGYTWSPPPERPHGRRRELN